MERAVVSSFGMNKYLMPVSLQLAARTFCLVMNTRSRGSKIAKRFSNQQEARFATWRILQSETRTLCHRDVIFLNQLRTKSPIVSSISNKDALPRDEFQIKGEKYRQVVLQSATRTLCHIMNLTLYVMGTRANTSTLFVLDCLPLWFHDYRKAVWSSKRSNWLSPRVTAENELKMSDLRTDQQAGNKLRLVTWRVCSVCSQEPDGDMPVWHALTHNALTQFDRMCIAHNSSKVVSE